MRDELEKMRTGIHWGDKRCNGSCPTPSPPPLAPWHSAGHGRLRLAACRFVLEAIGKDRYPLHAGFTPQAIRGGATPVTTPASGVVVEANVTLDITLEHDTFAPWEMCDGGVRNAAPP